MKQILITGANSGLGLASSKILAQQGHHIIMLCRDQQRGERAVQAVQKEGSAELLQCDLSDLDNIKPLSDVLQNRKIDVLLQNAGIVLTSRRVNPQGFEMTLAVNHLAVYLLTKTLWGCLNE